MRILGALSGNAKQGDKMLWSDQESNIIVYIVGNGAHGLLAMPKGEQVFAIEMIDAFKEMRAKGMFKSMLVLMDTPESATFFGPFEETLEANGILAVSANGYDQDQHGTYCTPDETVNGKHIKTCMSDLFSALLFDEIENAVTDLGQKATWQDVIDRVANYSQKQNVSSWGQSEIAEMDLDSFFGINHNSQIDKKEFQKHQIDEKEDKKSKDLMRIERMNQNSIKSRDAKFNYFFAEIIEKANKQNQQR